MIFEMCRAKLKGKTGVCCRSDGTQMLSPRTRSGILQAVHLTEMLRGLTYVSSEQAVLHSSESSAIDLGT